MRLRSSLTKPLKNPKINEANKTKITKISTYEYDIDLWKLSDKAW